MIPYGKNLSGFNLFFRINGSPIYRAVIPGLISLAFFHLIHQYIRRGSSSSKYIGQPNTLGVLISSISFLIIFRLNNSYQRYWNACGDVFQMMSKWLDAVTNTAVYHLQQDHYNHIKPPSYYDHHDLNMYGLRRDRERRKDVESIREPESKLLRAYSSRSIECIVQAEVPKSVQHITVDEPQDDIISSIRHGSSQRINVDPHTAALDDDFYLLDKGRKDGGWGNLFDDGKSTFFDMSDPDSWNSHLDMGFASEAGGRTPALFLQELVHLASLCNAVALSTLRNDIEGSPSPLDMYHSGSKWPEVDPDAIKNDPTSFLSSIQKNLYYLIGKDKSNEERTAQNSKRPLPVIGGVSDNEIAFLQRARGASAKTYLAWNWLTELITREHLAGSLGDVGPPIISRISQYLSDGMTYYNQSRKVTFIPFPYPHAQITALFIFVIMFAVPLLMDEYSTDSTIGGLLTFFTVVCLAGAHEVARELENPFRNTPNDIPLVTLQAQFNEALITLYSGYHPDHYWDADHYRNVGERDFMKTNPNAYKRMLHPSSQNGLQPQAAVTIPKDFFELKNLVSKQQEEIQRLTSLMDKK